MEIFKLQKPDISDKLFTGSDLLSKHPNMVEYIAKTAHPEYLFWNKVRYKNPPGVTSEEFWILVKFWRKYVYHRTATVIRSEQGESFAWRHLPDLGRFYHEVDMNLGGTMESMVVGDEADRKQFITRGIMEEAIASSQLEGAHTTRAAAKKMLVEQRKPRNASEQMILNNYNGMLAIEVEPKNSRLSIERLFELHDTLTSGTMEDSEVGRLRRDSDEITVNDPTTGVILHIPPSETFLQKEMHRLVQYANDELLDEEFVHPVIKAIILHFWIGYLHPFTDGNGRMARAIFYRHLLQNGYWAFTYLPLSKVIKNSRVQYRDAYVYSEQDDNDLTYFIDYNVRKVTQARNEFEAYVKRKRTENSKMANLSRAEYNLNNRQIQLLKYLHKNPDATSTIKTHSKVNDISRPTARKDLYTLEELGFLESRKVGRERPFRATQKTTELLS